MTTSDAFRAHIEELERRAINGDILCTQSLASLSLLASGWRYGDPDPTDGPDDDGGGVVVDLARYRKAVLQLAA